MRISDWSSDVCSSDLLALAIADAGDAGGFFGRRERGSTGRRRICGGVGGIGLGARNGLVHIECREASPRVRALPFGGGLAQRRPAVVEHRDRSEEHTSELQSLMRISYAVFCLKKKTYTHTTAQPPHTLTT